MLMALRVFSIREGEQWRVWSVTPAAHAAITLDEAFRGGWLCFEDLNGSERRRLPMTEAPAGWEALPDDRLDLLRRVATPVAAPPLDGTGEVTTRRPIEDAARYRTSGPKSVVGGDDADL
jgi:hypothetical protein